MPRRSRPSSTDCSTGRRRALSPHCPAIPFTRFTVAGRAEALSDYMRHLLASEASVCGPHPEKLMAIAVLVRGLLAGSVNIGLSTDRSIAEVRWVFAEPRSRFSAGRRVVLAARRGEMGRPISAPRPADGKWGRPISARGAVSRDWVQIVRANLVAGGIEASSPLVYGSLNRFVAHSASPATMGLPHFRRSRPSAASVDDPESRGWSRMSSEAPVEDDNAGSPW